LGVVWFSRFLRPSADDYCAGAVAQLGVFGAPLALWNTWAGFLFRNLIENILMGLPLLYLPWSFASSISFLISAIGLGLVVYFLLSFDAQDQFQKKLMFFLVPFMWWSYLWIPTAITHQISPVANGLTHWQTLTSGYMVTTEILIILWAIGQNLICKRTRNFLLLCFFGLLGILFGFTSEPINLAAFSALFLAFAVQLLRYRRLQMTRVNAAWLIFGFCLLMSFTVAHLSPGNLSRTALINPNLEVSLERFNFLFFWTIPYSIENWLWAYFNWGGALIFGFVVAFYFFMGNQLIVSSCFGLFKRACQLSFFGLLIFLVARFTEAFSYEGYWHFIPGVVCVFLSILFWGAWVGISLKKYSHRRLAIFMMIFLIFSLAVGVFGNYKMVKSIYLRGILWSQGSAPLPGVADIEEEWVRNCWIRLKALRPDQNSQSR